MRKQDRTEVLVVGAGPVGMFTALRLAGSGIDVQLIDQESRTAGRSCACALHPRTLELLDEAGVARDAIRLGHRIETVAFYEDAHRRTELKLSRLPGKFPFVLVLQQSILEDLLEQKLKERTGLKIHWNHRLTDLEMRENHAEAGIEVLAMAGKGYVVPEFDLEVKKTVSVRADFVVGADGQNSIVRQQLGITSDQAVDPQLFTIYELETEAKLPPEVRIVLNRQTVSVLWPFAENECRWSFQWLQADAPADFPRKDRNRFVIAGSPGYNENWRHLDEMLSSRAPWFQAGVKNIGWTTDVQFEHRLARRFGRDRAWLAGDAAHQTGPAGMQSMNMGFREGAGLAARLNSILREKSSPDILATYNLEYRTEWEQLLGWKGDPKASAATNEWAREHCGNIPSCIPASGIDLTLLLLQLGLNFDYAGLQEASTLA